MLIRIVFGLIFGIYAQANVELPNEVLDFNDFTNEFRNPLVLKIDQLSKSYSIKEFVPGKIVFLNDQKQKVADAEFFRSRSANQVTDIISYKDDDGHSLFLEELTITGSKPNLGKPEERIFLKDSFFGPKGQINPYSLQDGEDSRLTKIFVDNNEVFRFYAYRVKADKAWLVKVEEVYVSNEKILTLVTRSNDEIKYLDYSVLQDQFVIKVFNSQVTIKMEDHQSRLQVEGRHLKGFILPDFRFFDSNKEVFGLNSFVETLTKKVFGPIFATGFKIFSQQVLIPHFPKTVQVRNLGASGRFLQELRKILVDVQAARADQTRIHQIEVDVIRILKALEEGTLTCTDLRPAIGEE